MFLRYFGTVHEYVPSLLFSTFSTIVSLKYSFVSREFCTDFRGLLCVLGAIIVAGTCYDVIVHHVIPMLNETSNTSESSDATENEPSDVDEKRSGALQPEEIRLQVKDDDTAAAAVTSHKHEESKRLDARVAFVCVFIACD